MKRTAPSPGAKTTPIGTRFALTSFEARGNQGEYRALRPRLDSHDERVQRALIGSAPWWRTAFTIATKSINYEEMLRVALLTKENQ